LVLLAAGLANCSFAFNAMRSSTVPVTDSPLLQKILKGPDFARVMENPDRHRLQIILSQIDRSFGRPRLMHHSFRLRPREYFYPASLVKLPTALLSAEKITSLHKHGITWDTPYDAEAVSCERTTGSVTHVSKPTIKDDITLSLAFSDNAAFDRLYSFTGPGYLTESLRSRGYPSIQITHRLGKRCSPQENRITHPVSFFRSDQPIFKQEPIASEAYETNAEGADVVIGYPGSGRSFGTLADFHWMTIAALLPEAVEPRARFQISDEMRAHIAAAMSLAPEDYAGPTAVDREAFTGSPLKFVLMGGGKERVPSAVRIFSKSGKALGFLSETGLYLDQKSGVAFFLSATVYVNYLGSGEDADHHYEDIGLPFLRALGERVLDAERLRGGDPAILEIFPTLARTGT